MSDEERTQMGRRLEASMHEALTHVRGDVGPREIAIEALRRDIQEGLDSPSKVWSLHSFLDEARSLRKDK